MRIVRFIAAVYIYIYHPTMLQRFKSSENEQITVTWKLCMNYTEFSVSKIFKG